MFHNNTAQDKQSQTTSISYTIYVDFLPDAIGVLQGAFLSEVWWIQFRLRKPATSIPVAVAPPFRCARYNSVRTGASRAAGGKRCRSGLNRWKRDSRSCWRYGDK
jgi:hypothetical protein